MDGTLEEKLTDVCQELDLTALRRLVEKGADLNLLIWNGWGTLYDVFEEKKNLFLIKHCFNGSLVPVKSRKEIGQRFFAFQEFLLEHSAKTHEMLTLKDRWNTIMKYDAQFFTGCLLLDWDILGGDLLTRHDSILDTQDWAGDGYEMYVGVYASHFCRNRFACREDFESRVVDVLKYFTDYGPMIPFTALKAIAFSSLSFGYPKILLWTMGRLNMKNDRRRKHTFALLARAYRMYSCLFPDEICSAFEHVFSLMIEP